MTARKIWRSKFAFEHTHNETLEILSRVKIASDKGDWGARAMLAYFYRNGLGQLESNHALDADPDKYIVILQSAVAAGIPWGYYDLGLAHENAYGVAHDKDKAWAYYLKAAQLGSPEAQMTLAGAYKKASLHDAALKMEQCAFEQGHGRAAFQLGMRASFKDMYVEEMIFYQQGAKFGSTDCIRTLYLFFTQGYLLSSTPAELERLHESGYKQDTERGLRYKAIFDALEINPDLKFSRIEKVLPLPPAALPVWDGVPDAIEPESTAPPTY